MGNPYDSDREHSRRNEGRGANFNQQGQQVNGPQYNAEQINFNASVSPDAIAEGLRRYREPPPRPGLSPAEIQRRKEEADLKHYGYRHYSRDRKRWLQSLTPEERQNEKRRESDRIKREPAYRHHQRILKAGKLPPETSPADPRYVQAKREVESKNDKRELYFVIASIVVVLALILIAVLDHALWMAVILGVAMAIGLVSGYRKRRASA